MHYIPFAIFSPFSFQDPDMFWDFITLRPETTHQERWMILWTDSALNNGVMQFKPNFAKRFLKKLSLTQKFPLRIVYRFASFSPIVGLPWATVISTATGRTPSRWWTRRASPTTSSSTTRRTRASSASTGTRRTRWLSRKGSGWTLLCQMICTKKCLRNCFWNLLSIA